VSNDSSSSSSSNTMATSDVDTVLVVQWGHCKVDFVTGSCCGWHLSAIEPKISEKSERVVCCYSIFTVCGFSILPFVEEVICEDTHVCTHTHAHAHHTRTQINTLLIWYYIFVNCSRVDTR
jgi:hypothetical protein